MTHALHRKGDVDNLCDDYAVLIMAGMGWMEREDIKEKVHNVWDLLKGYETELANFGTLRGGGRHKKSFEEHKNMNRSMIHAVFKTREALKSFIDEIAKLDLGLPVTVSGLYDDVNGMCSEIGISPHTVQYSLGISGNSDRLPDGKVLDISTMCGHAMVAPNLIGHVLGRIEKGKMTHSQGAEKLAEMCDCGLFNPLRAEKLLRKMV